MQIVCKLNRGEDGIDCGVPVYLNADEFSYDKLSTVTTLPKQNRFVFIGVIQSLQGEKSYKNNTELVSSDLQEDLWKDKWVIVLVKCMGILTINKNVFKQRLFELYEMNQFLFFDTQSLRYKVFTAAHRTLDTDAYPSYVFVGKIKMITDETITVQSCYLLQNFSGDINNMFDFPVLNIIRNSETNLIENWYYPLISKGSIRLKIKPAEEIEKRSLSFTIKNLQEIEK